MSDPFKKWRKKWPNWVEPYAHADLLTKDTDMGANLVDLTPETKRKVFARMPDELKDLLRELKPMGIKAVYFEDGVC